MLRVFAVWVLLDGLAMVPRAFFERELTIGSLVAPEIWRGVVIAAVSLGLAWLGWRHWSLVIGDLVGAALLAGYSWGKAWGKIPLKFESGQAWALIRKSYLLCLIWITLQLVTYIDLYIVDLYRGTHTAGLYVRTYGIAFLVATIVYPRAFFPTLMAYFEDRPRYVEFFRLGTVQLLGCQVVASYFLFFNAERVISILLGDNWLAAAPILRAVAFIPFFDQFTQLGGEMLKAEHRDLALAVDRSPQPGLAGGLRHRPHPALRRAGDGSRELPAAGNLVMAWEVARLCRVHSWLVAPAHFPKTAVVPPVTQPPTTSSSLFAAKVMFCAAPAVQVQMTILLNMVVLAL